jgi:hypothetical protein
VAEPIYADFAGNRANLSLSEARLRRYQPEVFGLRGFIWSLRRRHGVRWMMNECVKYGDTRAALVWSAQPLLIAAYSDEFDAILMLRFPDRIASDLGLSSGQRLLSVNAYGMLPDTAPDIEPGELATGTSWCNFLPTIAEIFCEDAHAISRLKPSISESEWQRTQQLAERFANVHPGHARNGLPLFAGQPVPFDEPR